MRRLNAFSLMEMMIVLLIVAIIAAASSPMISRKMAGDGSGTAVLDGCGWQSLNGDTVFNIKSDSNRTVLIGSKNVIGKKNDDNTKPRLFVKSNEPKESPHVVLYDAKSPQPWLNLAYFNSSVWLSTKPTIDKESTGMVALGFSAEAKGDKAIAIGTSASASSNSIAIGGSAHVSKGANVIALGRGAGGYGDNAIAIGTVSAGENEVRIGTPSHNVNIGGCTLKDGVITAKELHVNKLYVEDDSSTYLSVDNTGLIATGNMIINGAMTTTKDTVVKGNLSIDRNVYAKSDVNISKLLNAMGKVKLSSEAKDVSIGVKHYSGENPSFSQVYKRADADNRSNLFVYDSDRRLKNVGEVFKGGLDEIKKLEVFNYTYKKDKDKNPRVGVMAQDLQKIFPNAVVKGDDGFLRIRMEDMFYALVNAVKELDRKIDLLVEKQKEIEALKQEIQDLKKDYSELEKRLVKLVS